MKAMIFLISPPLTQEKRARTVPDAFPGKPEFSVLI
jgi:hypothetical protein